MPMAEFWPENMQVFHKKSERERVVSTVRIRWKYSCDTRDLGEKQRNKSHSIESFDRESIMWTQNKSLECRFHVQVSEMNFECASIIDYSTEISIIYL